MMQKKRLCQKAYIFGKNKHVYLLFTSIFFSLNVLLLPIQSYF
jgi:hypothetical protein